MKIRLPLFFTSLPALLCLVHAQMSPSPQSSSDTGIEGTITMSPVMGGPTRQDMPDSRPLPNIAFEVRQGIGSWLRFKPTTKAISDRRWRQGTTRLCERI